MSKHRATCKSCDHLTNLVSVQSCAHTSIPSYIFMVTIYSFSQVFSHQCYLSGENIVMIGKFMEIKTVPHPRMTRVHNYSAFFLPSLSYFTFNIFLSEMDDIHIWCFPFLPACLLGLSFLLRKNSLDLALELFHYLGRFGRFNSKVESHSVDELSLHVFHRTLDVAVLG